MKPPIPDGQRCLNCKQPATNGKINHGRGCPDWTKGGTTK